MVDVPPPHKHTLMEMTVIEAVSLGYGSNDVQLAADLAKPTRSSGAKVCDGSNPNRLRCVWISSHRSETRLQTGESGTLERRKNGRLRWQSSLEAVIPKKP